MITRGEFFMIKELYRKGMSISDIARQLGIDRKTVRKYLGENSPPLKKKRTSRGSKLDRYKDYLHKRMIEDGVFNSEKLYGEIQSLGYTGGRTILKDYIKPFRDTHRAKYTVRYETLPGEQMQVDWKEIGTVILHGEPVKLTMFVAVLGYSRMKYAEVTTSQDQEHLMQCLIHSFKYFGGVPQHILFDNMKTVTDGREQGVVKWNERFAEFASYYSFTPKACKPYRAQTKGKVERAIQYIMNSFYVGTSYDSIEDLNQQLLRWLDRVGNRKKNDTTGVSPQERWAEEKLQPILQKADYDTSYRSYRKTHFDGTFSYRGVKWIVDPEYSQKEILVKESLDGQVTAYYQGVRISCKQLHENVIFLPQKQNEKQDIGVGRSQPASHFEVHTRSLSEYDELTGGEMS
jgi:transposase